MGSYTGQRRQTSSVSGWIKFALLGVIVSFCFQAALGEVEPTESQCRPYIEKALKEQHLEADEQIPEGALNKELVNDQEESPPTDELTDSTEGSIANEEERKDRDDDDDDEAEIKTETEDDGDENEDTKTEEDNDTMEQYDGKTEEHDDDEEEDEKEEKDISEDVESNEDDIKEDENKEDDTTEDQKDKADEEVEKASDTATVSEDDNGDDDGDKDAMLEKPIDIETQDVEMDDDDENEHEQAEDKDNTTEEDEKADADEKEVDEKPCVDGRDEKEKHEDTEVDTEDKDDDTADGTKNDDDTDDTEVTDNEDDKDDETKADVEEDETKVEEKEEEAEKEDVKDDDEDREEKDSTAEAEEDHTREEERYDQEGEEDGDESKGKTDDDDDSDGVEEKIEKEEATKSKAAGAADSEAEEDTDQEAPEEEELIKGMVIPDNLRPRDHIDKILRLEESGIETILEKTIDATLKGLKGLYDNAIKPLEMLYKYRDLSNRHFGDPEIFSKPLILFMGPWSGGKSSTINYLLDNEFSHTSLRTGAEPSPAYFNILMYGEEEEILDGTQLAADWTFSGLQKFGQGLLDRLKGVKLPNKLLEKVNIVEIPGILEIRKQVQRLFPFNDACQWFIDRADIIFLVYDPSKLDVGPETEAILDQLKGREYQTRIILNKADQVKPEELMRVQGTLIWNISPLMSSSEPPIMYSTSLWSLPYEVGAPTRLLQAQERAFLKDLREAIDKRVENKISSARRFAVRVRNHAKMVDCYLTTYYNHKSIFGNRKKISDDIIEYPQKYHIYEGLSTLTNISRYDLPDPDVYRDFFKINPLYEFKKLSETCTYFRGCPINKLDVAIAYDLPELVGKYKKAVETAKEQQQKENS